MTQLRHDSMETCGPTTSAKVQTWQLILTGGAFAVAALAGSCGPDRERVRGDIDATHEVN